MKKNRYIQAMERTQAPQEQVDAAIDRIYSEDFTEATHARHKKSAPIRWMGAACAAMVAVVLACTAVFGFGKSDNTFAIKAGAAELNRTEYRGIGELQAVSGGFGATFDNGKTSYVILPKGLEFPITAEGNNLKSITYRLNGKGYFSFDISQKNVVEGKSVTLPFEVTDTEDTRYFVSEYVDETGSPAIEPELILYTDDRGGKYCEAFDRLSHEPESDEYGTPVGGSGDAYEQWYCEMFEADPPSLDITVTFADGSTETRHVDFSVTLVDHPLEDGIGGTYQTVEISAKLV